MEKDDDDDDDDDESCLEAKLGQGSFLVVGCKVDYRFSYVGR